MNTRRATDDDVEEIARLHAESWRTAYRGIYRDVYLDGGALDDRLWVWRERFAAPDPRRETIVVEDGGEMAGFICMYGDDDPAWGSLIDNLHVAPNQKRAGIGRVLMREGARWLQDHYEKSPVYLWVLEGNANARGFYARLGAAHAETVMLDTADGGRNSSCRYTWRSPADLVRACS
jgi:ribosomal protein S18 acetylase RimI-like enzyme